MAERVIQHTVTIAAGTATDTTFALGLDNWQIEAVDLEVPAGPAGQMQFYLANNGQPFIPRSVGEYLVWDDHVERFPATDYPTAGGWQIIGRNTGKYAHAVIVRFHVNQLAAPDDQAAAVPFVITFVEREIPDREIVTL